MRPAAKPGNGLAIFFNYMPKQKIIKIIFSQKADCPIRSKTSQHEAFPKNASNSIPPPGNMLLQSPGSRPGESHVRRFTIQAVTAAGPPAVANKAAGTISRLEFLGKAVAHPCRQRGIFEPFPQGFPPLAAQRAVHGTPTGGCPGQCPIVAKSPARGVAATPKPDQAVRQNGTRPRILGHPGPCRHDEGGRMSPAAPTPRDGYEKTPPRDYEPST